MSVVVERLSGPDRTVPTDASQGTLALVWTVPGGLPAAPVAATPTTVIRSSGEVTVDGGRPEAGSWVGTLVQSVIEVLSGDRPAQQLMRWLDLPVYTELVRRCRRGARRGPPPEVRSVHLFAPTTDVVEATVVVGGGATRVRAVAVRLEGVGDRWRCTQLAFL
jgi:Family of unknown function (DUF6459)